MGEVGKLVKLLPGLATRAGRGRYRWALGWRIGRLLGSVRFGVFAL